MDTYKDRLLNFLEGTFSLMFGLNLMHCGHRDMGWRSKEKAGRGDGFSIGHRMQN